MPTIIYKTADGKRVSSVTTINKIGQDSGGLIHWAWNLGIEGKDYREARNEAADAGTLGHVLVDAALHDTEPDLTGFTDEAIAQARKAFAAYQEWRKQTQLKFIASETPLVSEKYKFGGCMDAVAIQNKKYVLCDWKTGALYPDYRCQIAAYGKLWEEHSPEKKIEGYHLCRFNKQTGDFVHAWYSDLEDDWKIFLLKLDLYNRLKEQKKKGI